MRRLFLCAAALAATAAFTASAHAQGRPRVVLYQEDNFRGREIALESEVASLGRELRFNDKLSSVRVLSGTWEFCDDDNFRGRCFILSRDDSKLSRMGWDDRVSSVRPVGRRDGPGNRYDDRRDRQDDRRDDYRRDDYNRR